METLELKKNENYKCPILSKYDTIPALEEAIAEIERGEVVSYNSFEEYLADMHRDDEDEI